MRQKLHLVTAKDELRPVMNYALLTKERITVTDAHSLVSHLCTEIFDELFTNSIPEGEWLIPESALKLMNKPKAKYWIEGTELVINDKGATSKHPLKENGKDMKFPNWQLIIPDENRTTPVETIGVNTKILENTRQAIDSDFQLALTFTGGDRPIILTSFNKDLKGCISIIMPMMILA
jgi:hypothetical protein